MHKLDTTSVQLAMLTEVRSGTSMGIYFRKYVVSICMYK